MGRWADSKRRAKAARQRERVKLRARVEAGRHIIGEVGCHCLEPAPVVRIAPKSRRQADSWICTRCCGWRRSTVPVPASESARYQNRLAGGTLWPARDWPHPKRQGFYLVPAYAGVLTDNARELRLYHAFCIDPVCREGGTCADPEFVKALSACKAGV